VNHLQSVDMGTMFSLIYPRWLWTSYNRGGTLVGWRRVGCNGALLSFVLRQRMARAHGSLDTVHAVRNLAGRGDPGQCEQETAGARVAVARDARDGSGEIGTAG
jgi:hypothetical protein